MPHAQTIFDTEGDIVLKIRNANTGIVHDLATIEFIKHDQGLVTITTKQAREIIDSLMRCYFTESYPINTPTEPIEMEKADES